MTDATTLPAASPALLGFGGDPTRKTFYVDRIEQHEKADEIVKGKYWEGGKGCAVGCSIHGSSHSTLAEQFGIPVVLARLEDHLFENQSNASAKTFPGRFAAAIRVGSDQSATHWKWLHWILTVELHGKHGAEIDTVLLGAAAVLEAPMRGEPIDQKAASAAALAAREAAAAASRRGASSTPADAAAWAAAAAEAEAAEAARAAAEAAAWAEAWAWAAAAWAAAAWAAAEAAAAEAAAWAAAEAYDRLADKLIEFMAAA